MSTQFQQQLYQQGSNGQAAQVQLPVGAQQGAYGVQVLPSQQPGYSYSPDALPPPPPAQQTGQVQVQGQPQTYGLPQQQFAQQPQVQGQPQQQGYVQPQQQYVPQAQQVPQGAAQVNANTRLDGPGVPAEIRGRTLGEALGIYSALRNEWLQRQGGGGQTPAAQSLAAQGIQPQGVPGQQPAAQNGVGAPPAAQGTPFWQNPEERIASTIDRVIQERIGPMLQPVVQNAQQNAIVQARAVGIQGIGDYQMLEPAVMEMLAAASPQQLADPQTWVSAAHYARGKLMSEGRYNAQVQRPQAQVPGQQYASAMPAVPAGTPQVGAQPQFTFFTEAPTAPLVGQGGGQPSAMDIEYARKFNQPIERFMAWKHGVQAPQQQGGF